MFKLEKDLLFVWKSLKKSGAVDVLLMLLLSMRWPSLLPALLWYLFLFRPKTTCFFVVFFRVGSLANGLEKLELLDFKLKELLSCTFTPLLVFEKEPVDLFAMLLLAEIESVEDRKLESLDEVKKSLSFSDDWLFLS